MATLFRFFGRGAIGKESEQILKLFLQFRIQQARSSAFWTLHFLVMPAAAAELFRIYDYFDGMPSWRSAISAQENLKSNYFLEGTLIMACIQLLVVFPTLVTAKSLDLINVFFSLLCVASTL